MTPSNVDMHCPETRQLLTAMTLAAAQEAAGPLRARQKTPFAGIKMVLLREDHKAAYPIVNETPILLVPEALTNEPKEYDLRDRRWSEAYEEMDFYNRSATDITE